MAQKRCVFRTATVILASSSSVFFGILLPSSSALLTPCLWCVPKPRSQSLVSVSFLSVYKFVRSLSWQLTAFTSETATQMKQKRVQLFSLSLLSSHPIISAISRSYSGSSSSSSCNPPSPPPPASSSGSVSPSTPTSPTPPALAAIKHVLFFSVSLCLS